MICEAASGRSDLPEPGSSSSARSSLTDIELTSVHSARPSSKDDSPNRPFVLKTIVLTYYSQLLFLEFCLQPFVAVESLQYVHLHKHEASIRCQCALKTRRPVLWKASLQASEPECDESNENKPETGKNKG